MHPHIYLLYHPATFFGARCSFVPRLPHMPCAIAICYLKMAGSLLGGGRGVV